MHFTVLGEIRNAKAIARGSSVEIRKHLTQKFGAGRWRKMTGEATIQLEDGTIKRVELHWFEAHGLGRVYFKRKRRLDWRA